MSIVRSFYDKMATHYDKLFLNWQETTREQALILQNIFQEYGFDHSARILDCACGIGTQSIGLGALGYAVTGSDISEGELAEAERRAAENQVAVTFRRADFCALEDTFAETFDIVIAMDNALPHMLTEEAMNAAIKSIIGRLVPGGLFVASIRDYDRLLEERPPYSPPYIHETEAGRRVSFQIWQWEGEIYRLTQYILEDAAGLQANKYECVYRAVRREEMTRLLLSQGCREVVWKFPEETGFYQPIVVAVK